MSADLPLVGDPAPAGTGDDERILVVEDVSKHFGGVAAVDFASLDVRRGSITALIGPNGAGKTTLFNVVSGFFRPETGRVVFDGRRIDRRPPYTIAKGGLVRTFQITKVLTKMTVLDNMMLPAPDQPGERLWEVWLRPGATRKRQRRIRERAMDLLAVFQLDRLADEYAGALSGGQRKLLELARSLMAEPRMVLLDEPMAGVNPTLGRRLLEHIERLRDDWGMTFFYIEHDMEVVMNHSERVIVMADGRVIADGPPGRVREDDAVIDAYLGEMIGSEGGP